MMNLFEVLKPHLDNLETKLVILIEAAEVKKDEKKNKKLVDFKAEVTYASLNMTQQLGDIKKTLLTYLAELKKAEEN